MGVTIESKNKECDMGYGGFFRFRQKVAEQSNQAFGKHYNDLSEAPMFDFDGERKLFFEEYDQMTNDFVALKQVLQGVANFCYQSDCEGEIILEQVKEIYELIKDCEDDLIYGYQGRDDCALMKHMKALFKDCIDNGGKITWW